MKHWFAARSAPNCEVSASLAVAQLGYESYVPTIQIERINGRTICDVTIPRFPGYIFARFDRDLDDWGAIQRISWKREDRVRFLRDKDMRPSPIPDAAMEAVKAFRGDPVPVCAKPHVYQPGEAVTWIMAGVRRRAVFVGYCKNRMFVRTWMFGAEHVTEVRTAELEPVEIG